MNQLDTPFEFGQPVPSLSQQFPVEDSQMPPVEAIFTDTGIEVERSDKSFIRKLGARAINLPHAMYYKAQYAAVALKNSRIAEVDRTLAAEWDKENLTGKAWLAAAALGQLGERTHLLTEVTIAPAAVHVFEHTHSPWIGGLSILAMVGAAQGAIAGSWVEGLDRAPETTEAIYTNFPKMVEYAEDVGVSRERHWYSNVREAVSSFASYGVTPFVIAEKIADPETTKKQSWFTAAQMTGKCALTGFVVGSGVFEYAMHDPARGQTIMHWAEKPWIWMAIAGVIEGPRLAGKRWARLKERREERKAAIIEEANQEQPQT